jgi:hypothetical protein
MRSINLELNNRKRAVVANAAPARVTPTETPEAFHSKRHTSEPMHPMQALARPSFRRVAAWPKAHFALAEKLNQRWWQ